MYYLLFMFNVPDALVLVVEQVYELTYTICFSLGRTSKLQSLARNRTK